MHPASVAVLWYMILIKLVQWFISGDITWTPAWVGKMETDSRILICCKKSLRNRRTDVSPFTCLVPLAGSGPTDQIDWRLTVFFRLGILFTEADRMKLLWLLSVRYQPIWKEIRALGVDAWILQYCSTKEILKCFNKEVYLDQPDFESNESRERWLLIAVVSCRQAAHLIKCYRLLDMLHWLSWSPFRPSFGNDISVAGMKAKLWSHYQKVFIHCSRLASHSSTAPWKGAQRWTDSDMLITCAISLMTSP